MWDAGAAASGSQGVFLRFMPSRRFLFIHFIYLFLLPACLATSFRNKFRHEGVEKTFECRAKEDTSYGLRGGFEKNTLSKHCVH